jgi:quercetin dioxygenase-like cupin family protein
MKTDQLNKQESKAVCLEANQIVSFKRPQNLVITSGKVWVTIAGDSQDYIYTEGQSVTLPRGKHTVVQALGKASFWF